MIRNQDGSAKQSREGNRLFKKYLPRLRTSNALFGGQQPYWGERYEVRS